MAKQGGLLGHVTVPRTYKAPGSHKVELAYITKKEANKLKELDLHNSGIGKEMHYGPEGIPNYNGGGGGFGGGFDGGGGGRAEVGKDDAREAARIVAAIASANKAAPGALERLGAQRVSAAQSGPRGALGRTPTQRAEPVRAPVSRPAPVVESAGSAAPQKSLAQKIYSDNVHPQKIGSALLGITPNEWVSHVTKPAPGNVAVNAPATAPASTRFNYASNKGLDFYNKSNIGQHFASGNPFEGLLAIGQLGGSALLGGIHQGWQGIQNMNDPNSPGHQFGAFEWESYPNLVDFGGNMVGLGRGLWGMGPTRADY